MLLPASRSDASSTPQHSAVGEDTRVMPRRRSRGERISNLNLRNDMNTTPIACGPERASQPPTYRLAGFVFFRNIPPNFRRREGRNSNTAMDRPARAKRLSAT